MATKLEKIRSDIAAVKAEIESVVTALLPDEQIEARVQRFLDECEELVREDVTGLANHLTFRQDPGESAWDIVRSRARNDAELAFALTVHCNREKLGAELVMEAKKSVRGARQEGAEARWDKAEELHAKLFALESEEEKEVMRLEATLEDVQRRGDADPYAVLGLGRPTKPVRSLYTNH